MSRQSALLQSAEQKVTEAKANAHQICREVNSKGRAVKLQDYKSAMLTYNRQVDRLQSNARNLRARADEAVNNLQRVTKRAENKVDRLQSNATNLRARADEAVNNLQMVTKLAEDSRTRVEELQLLETQTRNECEDMKAQYRSHVSHWKTVREADKKARLETDMKSRKKARLIEQLDAVNKKIGEYWAPDGKGFKKARGSWDVSAKPSGVNSPSVLPMYISKWEQTRRELMDRIDQLEK